MAHLENLKRDYLILEEQIYLFYNDNEFNMDYDIINELEEHLNELRQKISGLLFLKFLREE